MIEAPKQRDLISPPESALSDIVMNLSPKELYGYGDLKSFTGVGGQSVFVPEVVRILASAQDRDLISICRGLLARMGLTIDINQGRDLFKGVSGQVTTRELKYAFLRLLGVGVGGARDNFGYHKIANLKPSSTLEQAIKRVQEDRELFPLRTPEEFPGIRDKLRKIRAIFPEIKPEEIFTKENIPPMYGWMTVLPHAKPLLLDNALQVILISINGEKSFRDIATEARVNQRSVEAMLGNTSGSPLAPEILELIKKKRNEYTKREKQLKESRQLKAVPGRKGLF